ncbi:MAG: D-alanyl-D-alanine carboxypeptidase [Actinomycetales bacterium]|nr:D-alanyl-D-alanine carboxypeptidase [Actinomycetales bacterium]
MTPEEWPMRGRMIAPPLIAIAMVCGAPPVSADDGTARLPAGVQAIMDSPAYQSAQWTYRVVPLDGGAPLYSAGGSHLMNMGSIGKLYSVGTWLAMVGADWTTKTPVFKVGGNLVLVGKGDLVLGGRQADTGTLGYSVPPQPDANGIPGAKPAPGDPLAGLNSLAQQVKRSGATRVNDVQVDDRLFHRWVAHDEVISPIVVNDNLIAIQTTPTKKGEPPSLRIVPDTKAFRVVNKVRTVASTGDLDLAIVPLAGNVLEVRGTIPVGASPTLNVYHVPDPATFARTLFMEALERAGVEVSADPLAANSTKGLPRRYPSRDRVASFTSPTSKATATLIWMISHNYGANLVTCLIAVHNGSKDCTDGLAAVHDTIASVGIPDTAVWLLDGAGGEMSATTPEAITT